VAQQDHCSYKFTTQFPILLTLSTLELKVSPSAHSTVNYLSHDNSKRGWRRAITTGDGFELLVGVDLPDHRYIFLITSKRMVQKNCIVGQRNINSISTVRFVWLNQQLSQIL